jgi:hypothetical protein
MGQMRRPLALEEYRRVTMEKWAVKIAGLRTAKGTECWKSRVGKGGKKASLWEMFI